MASRLTHLALFGLSILSFHANAQVTTSTDWPSLQFHFSVKRNSMEIYGQSDFSMLGNPIVSEDGSNVRYDVFSSFTEDERTVNYTQVNGVAYTFSSDLTANCLDSESGKLPPINAIVKAVTEASSSGRTTECVESFKVVVNGIPFALCASESGFSMIGQDLDIVVEYLDNRVDIVTPTSVLNCKTVSNPSFVSSIGKELLTGVTNTSVERNLKPQFDFNLWDDDSSDDSCECKSTKRPCLFIHGMGVDEEKPQVVDSFSYYWGNLTTHAPCCSSFKYTVLNTVDSGWTNDTLQQQVCDRAVSVSKRSSKTVIADTILITHSMGNLMVAGAIATGKCQLDSSSTWVGMAGPMQGSRASDFVQEACAGETNFVLEKVANVTGRCPPTAALKSLPAQGGNHSSEELNKAYTAAQEAYTKNVSALMCSEGYSGLPSKYQAEFWVLGSVVPYESDKNDGMVEFASCVAGIPESKFGDTWKSKFYKTKLNHYDSEFLYGDALLDEKKMPIKWFECLL
ncbi:hypothetical protein V7S43_016925 [Phytophthora oleae]|uniref:Uncharacterized protein n=1 Tax=Phytophthora oleae TaxID=2107226 RepID=A0ABD3EUC1_9STRA